MPANQDYINGQQYVQSLFIIFVSQVLGAIAFLAVAYFINQNPENTIGKGEEIFPYSKYITTGIAVFAVVISYIIPSQVINKAAADTTLRQKLDGYRKGFIIKAALIQFPILLLTVIYFLSNIPHYLVPLIPLYIIQLLNFPSKGKLFKELKLPKNEIDIIQNNKTIS